MSRRTSSRASPLQAAGPQKPAASSFPPPSTFPPPASPSPFPAFPLLTSPSFFLPSPFFFPPLTSNFSLPASSFLFPTFPFPTSHFSLLTSSPPIPTGLRPKAQGWTAARRPTLGLSTTNPPPQRGCVPSHIRPALTPSAPAFPNKAWFLTSNSSLPFPLLTSHFSLLTSSPQSQRDCVPKPRVGLRHAGLPWVSPQQIPNPNGHARQLKPMSS
jgi:hypothetical protein